MQQTDFLVLHRDKEAPANNATLIAHQVASTAQRHTNPHTFAANTVPVAILIHPSIKLDNELANEILF